MSRPRKPTAVLEHNGAFKKDKSRRRVDPRTTGPLGPPPADLKPEEKERWQEIVRIAPEDVLANAERGIVELTCKLWAIMRRDGIGGRYGLNTGQGALLLQCFSKLGMTPSDRAKAAVSPGEEKTEADPYAEFSADANSANKPN